MANLVPSYHEKVFVAVPGFKHPHYRVWFTSRKAFQDYTAGRPGIVLPGTTLQGFVRVMKSPTGCSPKWFLFDTENGTLNGRRYLWEFGTRREAREHKKLQNSDPNNVKLVGPFQYIG